MMAGVISANVLVVALAKDLLSAGASRIRIHRVWGGPAARSSGGFAAGTLARKKPYGVLIVALATLAVGHTLFPYARVLAVAVAMNALFGVCRALGGVLTQSSIMTAVPRRLMGRTQSAFSVIATILQVMMSFTLGMVRASTSRFPLLFCCSARSTAAESWPRCACARFRVRHAAKTPAGDLVAQASACGLAAELAEKENPQAEVCATKLHEERPMKVFIAGASGVLGRRLVRQFVGARPFGDRASAQRESRNRRERSRRRAAPRGFIRRGIPGAGRGRLRHRHPRRHCDSRESKKRLPPTGP